MLRGCEIIVVIILEREREMESSADGFDVDCRTKDMQSRHAMQKKKEKRAAQSHPIQSSWRTCIVEFREGHGKCQGCFLRRAYGRDTQTLGETVPERHEADFVVVGDAAVAVAVVDRTGG